MATAGTEDAPPSGEELVRSKSGNDAPPQSGTAPGSDGSVDDFQTALRSVSIDFALLEEEVVFAL